MSHYDFPGARWWKFDFHTHTPASNDFEDKGVSHESWLRHFMEKEIDCVAITDHNSGEWIDELKQENKKLKNEPPEWYRPLFLFPGVEISVHGGVHLLAIFDSEKTTGDINTLLGAVDYKGTKGESNDVTTKPFTEAADIIIKKEGIAIPAHVDGGSGLLAEEKGNTLKQALENKNIIAMELCDSNYQKPELYEQEKVHWAEVRGSDVHQFRSENFGKFTWIKMDKPSIEGLKLALIDNEASVNRDMNANPNHHAELIIEEVKVNYAKYMGCSTEDGVHQPLECKFSPFLNTIIGGRGSGKSTLIEFMRLLLRRKDDIPEDLYQDFQKYFTVDGENSLLLSKSTLSLIYRMGDTRYRLNWSAQTDTPTPTLEVETNEGGWKKEESTIKSRFPVYIYSQKEIFTLAQQPEALLDKIDKDPSIKDYRQEKSDRNKRYKYEYKQYDLRIKEYKEKMSQKSEFKGMLSETQRQIQQIEKSGHKKVLESYRKRSRQQTIIEELEAHWQDKVNTLENMKKEISPVPFDEESFNKDTDILLAIKDTNNKWNEINSKLADLIKESKSIIDSWKQAKSFAQWMKDIEIDINQYEQLRTQLEQQGINPDKYPQLLQQQAIHKKELKAIDSCAKNIEDLKKKKKNILESLLEFRRERTVNRKNFLDSVLKDNQSISIKVKSFGQKWDAVEQDIRKILQCTGGRFEKDFSKLKHSYLKQSTSQQSFDKIKKKLVDIRQGKESAADNRFASHIAGLPQESMSELMCWFPKDDLEIKLGSGQDIREGSPGQKSATLLAFILSYGTEPLLLDQPEDDLDNEMIYQLIVKSLRETKSKRQIIIVTHNANIVVNGDAEMVFPFSVHDRGQMSYVKNPASIQNKTTREKICDILEGGKEAFEKRYQRIHLEYDDV